MRRKHLACLAAVAAAVLAAGCEPSQEELAARHETTIRNYCLDCHDYAQREAGLALERVDLMRVHEDPEVWEKVAMKLRGELMPPSGNPGPAPKERASFVAYLESTLDAAAAARPNPGPSAIHRLNRTEYGNAVRDLLGLEIDPVEFLPADDEAYGFDNIADVLRVSPSLLEQYLGAAAKIAALAVGDPEIRPITSVYRAAPDSGQLRHIEGLPLGTRGGVLIRHYFPLDGEYDFSVFLLRNIVGYMTGLEWPHELEIAIDGERVFLAPVGGEEDNAMSDANFAMAANTIDERLRTRIFVAAGMHDVSVAFLAKSAAETHEPLELHTRNLDLQDMNGFPVVDYVNVAGPYNATGPGETASREQIFTCRPASEADDAYCAAEILSTLARRAYRRPISEDDTALLMRFYREASAKGGFERGIQTALRVILTSPAFLYRSEPDPAGTPAGSVYALDDLALASRLSFFLWSSLPDEQLITLAEQGRLHDDAVYAGEITRMLADPRSAALVENFAGQWLFLRNLQSVTPDPELFPNFDDNLRKGMRKETELLFEHVMREDSSVLELLTASYTFVNDRLADHYGIQGVKGSHFRKVELDGHARRGLLGHASILTVTSYPNRTSPVLRGKWIMENVLGAPPPAPPPDVPALEENEPGQIGRSVRERLADHRENPVCATCHNLMDPLGLALENFDAIGRYRVRDEGGPIDATGRMANGEPIDGPQSLLDALTAEPEEFVRVFTEKLMVYALGRGLEAYDMPTVRQITRDAAKQNYRFSAIVSGIANSVPFRMKRAAETPGPDAISAAGNETARAE